MSREAAETQTVIAWQRVSHSYGGNRVFSDINASVREGEKLIISGPSGCGKSTLLKMALGFVQPEAGAVLVRGESLTPERAWGFRKETGYMDQGAEGESGVVGERWKEFPDREKVESLLRRFSLEADVWQQERSELSGGERQRVALIELLLSGKKVYLLDEPTSGLDAKNREAIVQFFLEELQDVTLVVVSHDAEWIQPGKATVFEWTKQA